MCKLITVLVIIFVLFIPGCSNFNYLTRASTNLSIKEVQYYMNDNGRAEELAGIGEKDGLLDERDEKFSIYYAQGS